MTDPIADYLKDSEMQSWLITVLLLFLRLTWEERDHKILFRKVTSLTTSLCEDGPSGYYQSYFEVQSNY